VRRRQLITIGTALAAATALTVTGCGRSDTGKDDKAKDDKAGREERRPGAPRRGPVQRRQRLGA
jgi:hypothetical protein